MNEEREILDDLYELLNNLNDDLELDFELGENGYKDYEASYFAVNKYTLIVLHKKIAKWKERVLTKDLEAQKE